MDADEIRREDDKLITADVARAVEERELVAYYQPVFELASGRVANAEALVRWTMPDGTVVPAALFVPSLDRTDTIYGLDWYMAEEVCSFLSRVRGTEVCMPVSLNFSIRHAQDERFAQKLVATAQWHDVAHDLLRVEIAEANVLKNDAMVDAFIASIMEQGFVVVADNLATGQAGLTALAQHGIHMAKVSRAWWSEQDAASIAAFVAKANELGIALSAEGVEEVADVKLLRSAGVELAQGYYLAMPMDVISLERL